MVKRLKLLGSRDYVATFSTESPWPAALLEHRQCWIFTVAKLILRVDVVLNGVSRFVYRKRPNSCYWGWFWISLIFRQHIWNTNERYYWCWCPVQRVRNLMAHGDAREGKWREKMRMEWVASILALYVGTRSIQSLSADPHSSTASSRLNWHPRRFKWTRPFRWKTKSGFCACAITFRTCYISLLL